MGYIKVWEYIAYYIIQINYNVMFKFINSITFKIHILILNV